MLCLLLGLLYISLFIIWLPLFLCVCVDNLVTLDFESWDALQVIDTSIPPCSCWKVLPLVYIGSPWAGVHESQNSRSQKWPLVIVKSYLLANKGVLRLGCTRMHSGGFSNSSEKATPQSLCLADPMLQNLHSKEGIKSMGNLLCSGLHSLSLVLSLDATKIAQPHPHVPSAL